MSQHNYTNPAFCQQSEYYPSAAAASPVKKTISPVKVHRSESTRSIYIQQQRALVRNRIGNSQLLNYSSSTPPPALTPPKPGPKPHGYGEIQRKADGSGGSGRYALVPIEDLGKDNNGKYTVLPFQQSVSNLVKSQQNLDRYSSLPYQQNEEPRSLDNSSRFSSLPPVSPSDEPPRLNRAFSSDFGSKSFVVVDQKSMQRYEIVPTEDDEELVDDNHEIIQMHNGRAHRYAMIPTEEEVEAEAEAETCLDNRQIERSPSTRYGYATIREANHKLPTTPQPQCHSTPQKNYASRSTSAMTTTPNRNNQPPITPKKNNATQRLHEYLTTPTKIHQTKNFTPQKLQYDHNPATTLHRTTASQSHPQHQQQPPTTPTVAYQLEKRTTAVIMPRLMEPSIYSETAPDSGAANKSWNNLSFQKAATNGKWTIAIVSLMLVICGILNTGLTMYLIFRHGKSVFMQMALTAGIASMFLGIQGFRTRKYVSVPNRNYISGNLLVTVFSLINCCGLLVLLTLEPLSGSPLHDVTSGIILGLSSLTLLLISLGIIISKWCTAPPPDNRVDLY